MIRHSASRCRTEPRLDLDHRQPRPGNLCRSWRRRRPEPNLGSLVLRHEPLPGSAQARSPATFIRRHASSSAVLACVAPASLATPIVSSCRPSVPSQGASTSSIELSPRCSPKVASTSRCARPERSLSGCPREPGTGLTRRRATARPRRIGRVPTDCDALLHVWDLRPAHL